MLTYFQIIGGMLTYFPNDFGSMSTFLDTQQIVVIWFFSFANFIKAIKTKNQFARYPANA